MDKIPPEILYVVCSLLDVDDILNFRLVNKLMADIGAAYMLPEVTFYLHQEELDRLEAISLHPIFSKHVTSLTYFAETLDSPKVSWREFLRDHKRETRWNGRLRKLNMTPSQLMAEYHKYIEAVDEQDKLMEEKKDLELLKRVLPRFPRLEALTMSAGNIFYEGRYQTQRKKPLADSFRSSWTSGIHPEGKRPLDALLLANAHAPCALTTLRAGSLHWRFFKRSERELTRMFKPLANLTSIQLTVNVDPADERINEGNSLRKCQRVLAKGSIRRVLKSMPHLESLYVEILNLECDEQEKGAWLRDVIEPGFHWPNLKALVLGGIVGERMDFMNVFTRHKDTLRKLCLRDVTLASTSWRKLLPDIRKNLYLEEACICGDIYGQSEEEADMQESWDHVAPAGPEYWDLSVPEVSSDDMRQSINMYCRQGGEKYPDELPLCDHIIDKYYEEYVEPFFENDYDFDDDYDDDLEILGGENDGNWEDVSDEELDGDLSDDSINNLSRENEVLAFHMMLAGALGPHASSLGLDYFGGDDDDILDDMGVDAEGAGAYDDEDFGMEPPPWLEDDGIFIDYTGLSETDTDDDGNHDGEEMPALMPT